MKGLAKFVLPIICASLLLLPASGLLRAEKSQIFYPPSMLPHGTVAAEFKEYNFRYDGTKWVPGWLQCDADKDIMIFGVEGRNKSTRYESFPKRQPSQKNVLTLHQKGEPDCGMMKCAYTLVAQAQTIEVWESHYQDEQAFWTNRYSVTVSRGKGRTMPEQECRWFERTRLAVITDRRSIYMTENDAGELQYQSYNYQKAEANPSVTLKGGTQSRDERRRTEGFTFQSGEYQYVLNVSILENRPFVEVVVKKHGVLVQQERCLSYTYLRKS